LFCLEAVCADVVPSFTGLSTTVRQLHALRIGLLAPSFCSMTEQSLLLLLLAPCSCAPPVFQGALGLGPQAEGSPATAYEGAVFSSDDPEYKDAAVGKQQQTSAATGARLLRVCCV
jgi:hypothetical protein